MKVKVVKVECGWFIRAVVSTKLPRGRSGWRYERRWYHTRTLDDHAIRYHANPYMVYGCTLWSVAEYLWRVAKPDATHCTKRMMGV